MQPKQSQLAPDEDTAYVYRTAIMTCSKIKGDKRVSFLQLPDINHFDAPSPEDGNKDLSEV